MKADYKKVEDLQEVDFKISPVWEYVNDDLIGETVVRPVKRIPVKNLTGRLVGTQVKIANGEVRWALIGNVAVENPKLTEHFLTISIMSENKWFNLARYHDLAYEANGPEALAKFLDLGVDEVFPISYDITRFSIGNTKALSGEIAKVPRERLTRAGIIALAVP